MGYIPLSSDEQSKLLGMLSQKPEFNALPKGEQEALVRVLSGNPRPSDDLSEEAVKAAGSLIISKP